MLLTVKKPPVLGYRVLPPSQLRKSGANRASVPRCNHGVKSLPGSHDSADDRRDNCNPHTDVPVDAGRRFMLSTVVAPLSVVVFQGFVDPEVAQARGSGRRIAKKTAPGFMKKKVEKNTRALANARTRAGPSLLGTIATASYDPRWHAPPLVTLLGLGAVNAAGLWVVLRGLRSLQDNSDPVSLVRIQVGLVTNGCDLQSRLSQLYEMIQVGQQGLWLILEETAVEVLRYQNACQYADVSVSHLTSKSKAEHDFKVWADSETAKANIESQQSHPHQESQESGLARLFKSTPKTDVVVVTLIVAAVGNLDIPTSVRGWPDVRHALQQLTGLTSDRLRAIELLWTPNRPGQYLTEDQLRRDYPNLQPLATD